MKPIFGRRKPSTSTESPAPTPTVPDAAASTQSDGIYILPKEPAKFVPGGVSWLGVSTAVCKRELAGPKMCAPGYGRDLDVLEGTSLDNRIGDMLSSIFAGKVTKVTRSKTLLVEGDDYRYKVFIYGDNKGNEFYCDADLIDFGDVAYVGRIATYSNIHVLMDSKTKEDVTRLVAEMDKPKKAAKVTNL